MIGDGRAAVDVVICDFNMPGVDGLEFLRRIGDSDLSSVILLSRGGRADLHAVRELSHLVQRHGEQRGVVLLDEVTTCTHFPEGAPLTVAKTGASLPRPI